jgi:hypothetical protein
MRLSLILFVVGITFIVSGYTKQLSPECNNTVTTKVVPRHVYDEIIKNSSMDKW